MCRILVIAAMLLAGVSGCGSDNPETAAVSGTVAYNGNPVKTGTIILYPANANPEDNGRPAYGKISDGKITEVYTFKPDDGAILGDHKVVIQATEPNQKDPMYAGKSLVPQKYGDFETTELTTKIESGKENVLKLELTD